MAVPYVKFTEINPEFDEFYEAMNAKEKLTFMNIVNKMNGDVPPEGHYDADSGSFVFDSDNGESSASIYQTEDGDYTVVVETHQENFSNVKWPLAEGEDPGKLFSWNAGSVNDSKTIFQIEDDGSAKVYSGSVQHNEVEASVGLGGGSIGYNVAETEQAPYYLESPRATLDVHNNLVVDQGVIGVELEARVGLKFGVQIGEESKIDAGIVSFGVKIKGQNLEDGLTDLDPLEIAQLKLEAVNTKLEQMGAGEGALPGVPTAPEDVEAMHEAQASARESLEEMKTELENEVAVYREDQMAETVENVENLTNDWMGEEMQDVEVPYAPGMEPGGDGDIDEMIEDVEELVQAVDALNGRIEEAMAAFEAI